MNLELLELMYFIEIYNPFILVHVCDRKNNGGCSQICTKKGRKSACGCEEGFKLLPDKMSCEESKYFKHKMIR